MKQLEFAGPWAHRRVRSLVSSLGRCVVVSRPRKEGGPGPSAAKVGGKRPPPPRVNLPQRHGDLLFARDSFDAIRKHP